MHFDHTARTEQNMFTTLGIVDGMIERKGETVLRRRTKKLERGCLIRLGAEENTLGASFLVNTQAWLVNVE